MANLIPFSKSDSLITKPKINISSALVASSSIVKSDKEPIAKKSSDYDILNSIKTKVISVDKLLKSSFLSIKKTGEKDRKTVEAEKFKKREKELEKQKPQAIKGIKVPTPPKLGLFDWIKNFVFNTFLGFIAVRLVDHLPKLIKLIPTIVSVGEFFIDIGGKLLNGLVSFVDKAYDVVDKSRQFAKTLGGDGLLQNFDKFNGALSKMLDIAVIAAISAATMGDDFGGPGGPGATDFLKVGGKRGVNPQVVRRFIQRYGIDAARQKFGQEGIKSLGGKYARSGITNLARKGLVATLGKGGAKSVLKAVRPFLKRLPIPVIGALIDFGLSVALGEKPGKAAFKSIGAGLAGVIGTAIGSIPPLIPFGGPLIGGILGGWAGDALGSALYDMFFNNKKPNQKTVKAAGGGKPATRGGKLVSGPARRTIKKKKTPRSIKATAPKLRPGGSIGGEKNIKKIFPPSERKDQMNPFDFLKNTYENFSKSTGLGSLVALAIKPILGDRPTLADYKNAGVGINNWMNASIASGTLAYAGGGEVKVESIVSGEDYSDVISKTIQDSVSSDINKTIQDLMKQLNLKELDRGRRPGETTPGAESEPSGSPSLTGNSNAEKVFRYLVDKEGFTPEAAAGVIGNLMQESGVNPKSRQLGGGPGRGIMQWTESERWASLSAWAKNSGKDPWALETQVEWMVKEMKSYGTYNRIKGVSSYKKAVEIFEKEMERAGIPNYPRRYQFAADALASFSGGAGGGTFVGGGTGSGYGTGGVKIAGDLGDFMKANRGKIGVTGEIHQHPRHPGQFRRGYFSYHNQNRALDIGGWGPAHPSSGGRDEQAPVIRALLEWNKKNGYKPIEIIHGSPAFKGLGKYESAPNALHSNHVHVAYLRGGRVKRPTFATLAEDGRDEFVFDADTTAGLDRLAPGILEKLNFAKTKLQLASILQSYMVYEAPYGGHSQIIEVPIEIPVEIPVPISGGNNMMGSSGGIDSTYDILNTI